MTLALSQQSMIRNKHGINPFLIVHHATPVWSSAAHRHKRAQREMYMVLSSDHWQQPKTSK